MRFVRVPTSEANGHTLGQNVSLGERRLLKKGTLLGDREVSLLQAAGAEQVFVAQLDPTDVLEDAAAWGLALALVEASRTRRPGALSGPTLTATAKTGGRVLLSAEVSGLWRVEEETLLALNLMPGVTLATAENNTPLAEKQGGATLKIIPFALPEDVIGEAQRLIAQGLVRVEPWQVRKVRLLISGRNGREKRLVPTYRRAIEERLTLWGRPELTVEYVTLGERAEADVAQAIERALTEKEEVVLLAGETATMDEGDVGPLAIESLGGEVVAVGAPVYPGNLLLLAECRGQAIVGLPGCMRSPELNVVDLILPRVLAGERLTARDVASLGAGGLLPNRRAGLGQGDEA